MFIFDFEVFKYDWLVVFKNLATSQFITIVNDVDELRKFYEANKDKLFIGFNNKRYDDMIFKIALLGENPYYASQVIIEEDNVIKLYRLFDIKKYEINSLDISQDAMRGSLKEFEGYLGLDIAESSVPFDLDRALTEDEIKSSIEYCKRDVDATEYLTKFRIDAVKSKLDLIVEFGLDKSYTNKTNSQLCAAILGAKKRSYDDEFSPFDTDRLPLQIDDTEIIEFYSKENIDYARTLTKDIAGVKHILAYGGLHGAIENFHYEGELWLIDVASYYPSLMINWGYLSRGMPDSSKSKYETMYFDRLEMKAKGEKKKSVLYKIILNSVFGCMKSVYNGLYDPHNCNNVCISGQLFLIDLIEKLEPYCKLIQSNTDGLVIIPYDKPKIKEIVAEWEARTKMNMEYETANAIYQKDVNNYILVKDDDLKVRGGMVYQSSMGSKNHGGTMIRNTNSILADCVVNYFVNGITPETTISECNDLLKYQIISKSGGSYSKVVWEYDGEEITVNKVNRVYATIDTKAGKLYKIKHVGEKIRKDSIASLPNHCALSNDNTFDIKLLDKQYYIDSAWERINMFKGEKK